MKKIVFDDKGQTKTIRGEVDFSEKNFVKITDRFGKTLYVNREKVIFIREL